MVPITGALVYGTITVGALLAAESAARETYVETVGGVLIAMLAYWLAHAYSEFAAQRLEHGEPLTLSGLARVLAHELTIVVGAAVPLLALVICWVTEVSLASAVSAAIWTSAAMIVIIEVAAGVRARLTPRAMVLQAAAGACFGLLVIALKLVLH